MKSGTLTNEERRIWEEVAKKVSSGEAKSDIIVLDDVRNYTVDRVFSDIVKYQPDMVCIDYISLMHTPRSQGMNSTWEKLMFISNHLKQTARQLKVPIVAVAQTNRESAESGPELRNVSWSVAINQDSDIVLGLHRGEEEENNRQIQLKMLKNRDGRLRNTRLFWDMETMDFGPWDETKMFNRKAAEVAS
jgi:replicative DNA helicase